MLKAIHAQESRTAAQSKARDVVKALRSMKLRLAAELVDQHIDETLTYYAFPAEHWLKLKTNNPMERLLREARRRTKVVGAFPDGHSALMLVAARLRHVSATHWGTRKYMNMKLLEQIENQAANAAARERRPRPPLKRMCETFLTLPAAIRAHPAPGVSFQCRSR
jgi:putative transposase